MHCRNAMACRRKFGAYSDRLDTRRYEIMYSVIRDKLMHATVSEAPIAAPSKVKTRGSSFQRIMSDKEKESQAMDEMFEKAKRLDVDDDEVEGIPKKGNTDVGFDEDDWN